MSQGHAVLLVIVDVAPLHAVVVVVVFLLHLSVRDTILVFLRRLIIDFVVEVIVGIVGGGSFTRSLASLQQSGEWLVISRRVAIFVLGVGDLSRELAPRRRRRLAVAPVEPVEPV